jgi:hypothetical protein
LGKAKTPACLGTVIASIQDLELNHNLPIALPRFHQSMRPGNIVKRQNRPDHRPKLMLADKGG